MNITPKKMFLIDGLGALLTTFLLAVVLPQLENIFGMPPNILYNLALIAAVYAVYSLINYILLPKKWKGFMVIIAIANLLYCCLTLYFTFLYKEQLSYLGITYFLLEASIIIGIVFLEVMTIVSDRKKLTD